MVLEEKTSFRELLVLLKTEREKREARTLFQTLVTLRREFRCPKMKNVLSHQSLVVQRMDNTIHRINRYPVDQKCLAKLTTLSTG